MGDFVKPNKSKSIASQLDQATDNRVALLIAALGSKDPHQREQSREALVAAGHVAVIPLIEKLKSPDDQVCWEAAKALGAIKDPAAANALAETLDHNSGDVGWVAAESLIALGSEGLKQTLIALLTKAGSLPVQRSARAVVSHFAHQMTGESLKPLLARFHAFQPGVAIPPAALHAFHELERGNLRL
jgi:HEAT repeat protein